MKLIYCRDALCISISNEPYVFPDKERLRELGFQIYYEKLYQFAICLSLSLRLMKKDINRERILDLLVLQVVNA